MSAKRGYFVTFEGPDGSGKSTQARLMALWLRRKRIPVILTREPGGTPAAERIRRVLLSTKTRGLVSRAELLLFLASRAQHVQEKIRPALARGAVVICDRFSDSTLAYQAAGRGLSLAQVSALDSFSTAGLKPDLTLLLDVSAEHGLRRAKGAKGSHDRIESAGRSFHAKVRAAFLRLRKRDARRIKLIEVRGLSPDQVLERVLGLARPALERRGHTV